MTWKKPMLCFVCIRANWALTSCLCPSSTSPSPILSRPNMWPHVWRHKMRQTTDEPLQEAYLALATLEHRIAELHKLIERMSSHMIGYPALFTIGQAEQWKEDMFRLIEQAEKLQKEENSVQVNHL